MNAPVLFQPSDGDPSFVSDSASDEYQVSSPPSIAHRSMGAVACQSDKCQEVRSPLLTAVLDGESDLPENGYTFYGKCRPIIISENDVRQRPSRSQAPR